MLTELSSGIVTIFFNIAIIKFAGEDGVAAMAVNINIFYFLISIYLGIATGAQPVISYAYGAQNKKRLGEIIDHCKKPFFWLPGGLHLSPFLRRQHHLLVHRR